MAALHRRLGPLHHGGAARASIAPIHRRLDAFRHVKFVLLRLLGELRSLPGALIQPADLFFQPLVPLELVGVLPVKLLLPGVIIALNDLKAGFVDAEDVIHAVVQKGAVMAHQQKAVLSAQVFRHGLTAQQIQMIGRLVDQGISVLPGEQSAEQCLGLLTPAQGGEGTVQRVLRHFQQPHFLHQLPLRFPSRGLLHHVQGHVLRIGHGIGKIDRLKGQADLPAVGQLAHHQP